MSFEDPCQRNSTLITAYTAKKAISDMAATLIETHCANAKAVGIVCAECKEAIAYCSEEVVFADHVIDNLLRGKDILEATEDFADLAIEAYQAGQTEIKRDPLKATIIVFPPQTNGKDK